MPAVEISTIGAGGGSIAWIDQGGGLNVGPQSAGADPGPICFGKGGSEPTFTDAALVTGIIDPASYLGGAMQLDVDGAREGIRAVIAEPLGLDVIEAAAGIVELTEARMASLLHQLTVERGSDPRSFTVLGYGGGGPLVSTALADRLSMPRVVIPHSPATFSAWGMLTLDIVHDYARTAVAKLDRVEARTIREVYGELEEDGRIALDAEGVPTDLQRVAREIDLRYQGQEHTLTIPVDERSLDDTRLLRDRFEARHEALYGYRTDDSIDIVTYRVRSIGLLDSAVRPAVADEYSSDAERAKTGSRQIVHRASGGEVEFTVYSRAALIPGNRIEGPAVVEEETSTTMVLPGWKLEVDQFANLVIERSN
jgi:N-methylhydantoinase A